MANIDEMPPADLQAKLRELREAKLARPREAAGQAAARPVEVTARPALLAAKGPVTTEVLAQVPQAVKKSKATPLYDPGCPTCMARKKHISEGAKARRRALREELEELRNLRDMP